MIDQPTPPQRPTHRRNTFIGIGLAVLIIAVVTVVLLLAGGDKTGDGTGRDHQTSVTAVTTGSGPAAGSDR